MRWIVDNSFSVCAFPSPEAPQQGFSTRSPNPMDKPQFLMRLSTETGLIVDKPLFLKRLSIK